MSDPTPLARPESPKDLFIAFTLLALQGFGGVLAVAQRVLCDQRRWLTREQFVEILAIGQVLPGPNVCNVALMVGDRFFGWRGAFAALAGMMAVPLVIVLVVTAVYAQLRLPSSGGRRVARNGRGGRRPDLRHRPEAGERPAPQPDGPAGVLPRWP